MSSIEKSTCFFESFIKASSRARFESYRRPGQPDKEVLCKYVWNILLCEALYPNFQILEVAFRNILHDEIAKESKDRGWMMAEVEFLFEAELNSIKTAKNSILARQKSLNEDSLTAEMGFGFWTSLLDRRYDSMWPKIIRGVFLNMPNSIRTRGEASKIANPVRKLRNAALHHHSIWHWSDLGQHHQKMLTLIGYISSSSHSLAVSIDRFPEVYQRGYKGCESLLSKIG